MALAFEDFHLGGRVAATVRLALDPESPSAHHRNCTTGVSPEHERKQDG